MRDALREAIRVTDDVTAELASQLHAERGLDGTDPDADPARYAATGAKHLRNHLPAAVLERLATWRGSTAPWLTVSGLPGPAEPVATPVTGFVDEARLTTVNLVHFGMLQLLRLAPVAYRWENDGRLIRNVAPRPDAGDTLTSWGYSAPLDWHTDDSVLDHRPGADPGHAIPACLSFVGLRNDERVPTGLLPVTEVLAGLPEEAVAGLRRPEFTITAPESYAATDDGHLTQEGVPLLWTLPDGHAALRYGPGRATGRTTRAAGALAALEARLAALTGTEVLIGAGDFHVFDNRRVLHRRVPFRPGAPGAARWLRRVYAAPRQAG
ncbi:MULTISPECIES: TauD/TfdA family dioxygenase [Streptomycetaceae]|uniref:Putative clavaminate synthase-like (Oxidase) n=1 Tax=Streptantibioticus cattleyicolor (strain ATCC 35852 / DSM 46488 / JCM 4925 / NBRC 14057 / NRRL 8057) TaxID=1003195 RepID=F8JPL2_STREN|nr:MULTISPECIES: TauD/TfdA family dioxygenase [Streptomycetaceae]AEW97781.1 putative clavaminate synthase-like (oxidase) [Streptantibioticus cattleyicolor NRRL 8057 = DSM 46488]MYS62201.1 clavaminate synthase [Streptomyces sp. SID5468]CCB78099.1 putative clavaminate synthase-like (Oxidase) [Streptantibioticus cattleyicolor NRRL 8057 = DSM 46488]